jgi:Mlc titration factor MtfA (ptsG expression regulator)
MNLVSTSLRTRSTRNGEVTAAAVAGGNVAGGLEEALTAAYDDFCARIDDGEDTDRPYAAGPPGSSPCCPVFFASAVLRREYPQVYEQCAAFYRQDPAAGTSALPPE